jgi:hypothetical protein
MPVATTGAKADQLSLNLAPAGAVPPRPSRRPVAAPKIDATVIEGYRGGERTLTTFQKKQP